MGRQLSGLGIFAKWLVVPALMGAAGYYLIGPRIGGEILPGIKKEVAPAQTADPKPQADNSDVANPKSFRGEPEVSVEVFPAGRIHRPSTGRRAHKRRKKTVVAPTAPANPPDEGGSGGAATAGGTGATTGDTGGAGTGGTTGR